MLLPLRIESCKLRFSKYPREAEMLRIQQTVHQNSPYFFCVFDRKFVAILICKSKPKITLCFCKQKHKDLIMFFQAGEGMYTDTLYMSRKS